MCFWCGSAANIIHIFNIPKHLVKENIKEGYIFHEEWMQTVYYTDCKIFPKD